MRVTDELAALVLDPAAHLELRVPMTWIVRSVASVRAEMAVHNAHGLPVKLGVQLLPRKPWRLTAYLMIYNQQLRRLDVNASHSNPGPGGETWDEQTHKHRWSEQWANRYAYTPDDIPVIPQAGGTSEHYRGAFEAFCGESGVALTGEYVWSDPPSWSASQGGPA